MSDDNSQSQENDIIPIETLTAKYEEWKYGQGRSTIILGSTMAIISVISSWCLIRMIMTSKDRLSTTYHRLLLGMSIGDILYSLPIANFGAKSPTDVNYKVWNAHGNQATCTAAGIFGGMGMFLTLFYSCSLNIYYLIFIKYSKSDSYIRKKVEPFLHGITISLALILSIGALVNENYNDGGSGSCITAPIYNPPHCQGYEVGDIREGFTIPCGRGQGEILYWISAIVSMIIPPVVIGVSLGMLYRHVSKQERRMSRYGTGALNSASEQSPSDQNRDRSFSYAVLNKAIAYSVSYFLTWGWGVGAVIMTLLGVETMPVPYDYLWAMFAPLEGFFNLLIFMHPKVVATKKSNRTDNINWPRAFVKTFWSALSSQGSSQNNRTHAAASNDKKKKNAHAALAGSEENNKISATYCSTSVINTGDMSQLSTSHRMSTGGISEAENTEARASLGSDDFQENGPMNNTDES
eukprot:scaffold111227_cov23-Cyclotella_meneghiniana.AAC.1